MAIIHEHDGEEEIIVTPAEARQGATMVWPLRILILSTLAAGVGWRFFSSHTDR
jgi:hypothetical protein